MSLGTQIHEFRKKQNLSQEQLAEKIGVARQTISKWELDETAPDIKQARILSQIFDISLDELLGNGAKESVCVMQDPAKKNVPWKKIIAVCAMMIILCFVIVGIFRLVKRAQILHPKGEKENIVIDRQEPISIGKGNTNAIVFHEIGKPTIACELPEGFVADSEKVGFYTAEDGSFIAFNADYSDNVTNPLCGTDYAAYYEAKGYHSYMDMARAAMYYDPPKFGIFCATEKLYLAGGAQLIREQICAGKSADYYEIDGGLTESADAMRIYGFALHFDHTAWLIMLRDHNDIYYYITVRDPSGVGKTAESIAELLSTITITE